MYWDTVAIGSDRLWLSKVSLRCNHKKRTRLWLQRLQVDIIRQPVSDLRMLLQGSLANVYPGEAIIKFRFQPYIIRSLF